MRTRPNLITISTGHLLGAMLATSLWMPPSTLGQTIFEGTERQLRLAQDRSIPLTENIVLLNAVNSIAPVRGGEYYVAACRETSTVVLYDREGRQRQTLGGQGQGPFEHQSPRIVRAYDDRVLVWDSGLLRMTIYRSDGTGLTTHSINEGFQNFEFDGENLYLYISSGLRDAYVGVYSLREEGLTASSGERSAKHDILVMHVHSGGLALIDNTLYYASPAEPVVHVRPLDGGPQRVFDLQDPAFRVSEPDFVFRGSARELQQAAEFIFNNSRVVALDVDEDYLVVQTYNGEDRRNTRQATFTVLDRRSGRFLDRFVIDGPVAEAMGNYLRFLQDGTLYFVSESSPDGGVTLERRLLGFRIERM